MTLPASGPISLGDVNVELGRSATAQISMNESAVRSLFGKASGAIAMSDGRGKANEFAFTIASNQTNANLRTLAINAGWNQTSRVVATINSGVYVSSNSTGTPALTVNGSFPNGVTLINNGTIQGQGGNGGAGAVYAGPDGNVSTAYPVYAAVAGAAGGLALSVSSAITITNNGRIAGGGGGGGGGSATRVYDGKSNYVGAGGGGGGGGLGGNGGSGGAKGFVNAGVGGAGTQTSAGGGGARGYSTVNSPVGGAGGAGGTYGTGGSSGVSGPNFGSAYAGGAGGGSGGGAVSGNSNITWLATGTRNGSIT